MHATRPNSLRPLCRPGGRRHARSVVSARRQWRRLRRHLPRFPVPTVLELRFTALLPEVAMKRFGVLLLCVLLPLRVGTAQDAGQQRGTIAGTVTSQETGAPLAGAAVAIVGTRLEAAAGPDGRYTIAPLPPGTYRVRARLIGYASVVDTGVVVVAGQTPPAHILLPPQAVPPQTVVALR